MPWYEIVCLIFGAVGGLDFLRLLFFGKTEKSNKELETAREANKLLSEQLERSHETIKSLTDENTRLHEEKAELLETQACLFDDMCVHKGCRLRKPHPGQGRTWYNNYRQDPALGADFLSIDTLMKQERAARKNAESEDESTKE